MSEPPRNSLGRRFNHLFDYLSLGAWLILLIAIASSLAMLFWHDEPPAGMPFWTFARNHSKLYQPIIEQWNADHPHTDPDAPDERVNLLLISGEAMSRRMMSGFLSGTPVADLIEVERNMASQVFSGPVEDIGFVDLTDLLHEQGIYEQINTPSFSPWTTRGRIFGIPHDVHPVLLVYRADIVEAADIDVSQIETWDDFARIMKPLVQDFDNDGRPDRYPLSMWYSNGGLVEVLLLQAGGGLFDENDNLIINSAINARVMATIIHWTTGPDQIAEDAPEFSASGNQKRLDGFVVCSIMPDWLSGVWRTDMPQLTGKLKLMPLPAWEPGGRRTSVMGGTMLGVTKRAPAFDAAWAFSKHLYLSPELARELFEESGIISPVKSLWNEPFYDKPSPYFSEQPAGRLYIDQAPDVPMRSSSPFASLALTRVTDAMIDLRQYAEDNEVYDVESLIPEALRLLEIAEARVERQIKRNVFLGEPPEEQP